ncbi:repA protein [Coxiella burnetii]|nr:repA protein [Coxiella burnetii]
MEKRMNLAVATDKRVELKKHVNAIHCSNNLTLVQRKLFNALLFNAYPELPYKLKFQISAKDLCKLIGYNSNDYGKLKRALLGLITTAIEWNVIDCDTGKEKNWKASSILSAAQLAEGVCTYEYSHIMKELLFQPEIYGRIDVKTMSKFKSSYGLALYENCIRYQRLSQTPWFPLDVFRKLMGVLGGKYTSFKDFKKRVLNIAVNEVNNLSHIQVLPEIERQNQKVTKIRFKLNKKHLASSEKISNLINAELEETLTNTFSLSPLLIRDLLTEYDIAFIREKVNIIINSSSFQEGKIRGLSGYLIDSLRKDYKASKSSQMLISEARMKRKLEEEAEKEREERRRNRYEKYVKDKINKYLTLLTDAEKDALVMDFEVELKSNKNNKVFYSWYKKNGFEHVGVKACFHNFVKEHKKQHMGGILSFEEFISLVDEYT